jgi:type 1 fimbriae regulatory protein FimB
MQGKSNIVAMPSRRVMQKVSRSRNPAGRKKDDSYGRKESKYLSPSQVEALIKAAKAGRHGKRDALMISMAYHHALRVSELIHLEWAAIDLKAGKIRIARKKNGVGGEQHLAPDDWKVLRQLRKEAGDNNRYVFLSERGDPLTRDAFAKQLAAIGKRAGIDRRLAHPHALRHATGHHLANSGKVNEYQLQSVMGHRDPRSTQEYVQGVAGLIKGLWD